MLRIEVKATVVAVGRSVDRAGHDVELEHDGRTLKVAVDQATARDFSTRLYRDVRLTVDGGPEEGAPAGSEGGAYERFVKGPRRLADRRHPAFAVGATPEDAIRAYAEAMGWGDVENVAELAGGDPCFTWGRTFTAGSVGFKAAGWEVPGGVVMTWWK